MMPIDHDLSIGGVECEHCIGTTHMEIPNTQKGNSTFQIGSGIKKDNEREISQFVSKTKCTVHGICQLALCHICNEN